MISALIPRFTEAYAKELLGCLALSWIGPPQPFGRASRRAQQISADGVGGAASWVACNGGRWRIGARSKAPAAGGSQFTCLVDGCGLPPFDSQRALSSHVSAVHTGSRKRVRRHAEAGGVSASALDDHSDHADDGDDEGEPTTRATRQRQRPLPFRSRRYSAEAAGAYESDPETDFENLSLGESEDVGDMLQCDIDERCSDSSSSSASRGSSSRSRSSSEASFSEAPPEGAGGGLGLGTVSV